MKRRLHSECPHYYAGTQTCGTRAVMVDPNGPACPFGRREIGYVESEPVRGVILEMEKWVGDWKGHEGTIRGVDMARIVSVWCGRMRGALDRKVFCGRKKKSGRAERDHQDEVKELGLEVDE